MSVKTEDCSLCACGRMSLAPMYMRNPAKTPRYNTSTCSGRVKRRVEAAPHTGARASHAKSMPRASGRIVRCQDEADCIEPIGKIMGDDGESHQHTSLGTDLKPQANAETIGEAVPN